MRVLVRRLASLGGLGIILCASWFAMMELLLRHPGYGWRSGVAAVLAAQGFLTFAVCEDLFELAPFRWPLTAGAAVAGALGVWIISDDLARPGLPARPHFEGYLLIIGLALIVYGLLTVAAIGAGRKGAARGDRSPRRTATAGD